MATKITIQGARLSYCHLFQPRVNPDGKAKYSVQMLIPKTLTNVKALIDSAISEAIDFGVSARWNGVRPPVLSMCVHDGDKQRPNGEPYGAECKGCWVITASSENAPGVVDQNVQRIIDPTQVYSGMWGNVQVNFYPYDHTGHRGIACGLENVQKVRDDTPLSGRDRAEDVFKPVTNEAPAAGQTGGVDPITGAPLPLGF